MKVTLKFEDGKFRISCLAQTDAEKLVLGLLSDGEQPPNVEVFIDRGNSHYSYGKVECAQVTLTPPNHGQGE